MANLKIVYKPSGRAAEYASYAVNLYEGRCGHQCDYCYAPRALHKKPEEMGAPKPKKDCLKKLEADAITLREQGVQDHILMSFTTDPYQPIDQEYHLTRKALEILLSHGLNVAVLSKGGNRMLRDVDLFRKYKSQVKIGATLVFPDDIAAIAIEKGATPTSERISVLRKIHNENIRTFVSLEPVYTANESLALIDMTHDICDSFKIGVLNYNKYISEKVDWKTFARDVSAKLTKLNKDFYLKKDLRKFLQ